VSPRSLLVTLVVIIIRVTEVALCLDCPLVHLSPMPSSLSSHGSEQLCMSSDARGMKDEVLVTQGRRERAEKPAFSTSLPLSPDPFLKGAHITYPPH
jgi:hypothetical protein